MGLFRVFMRIIAAPPPRRSASRALDRPVPREMRIAFVQPNRRQALETIVKGRCCVLDGDTIVIDKTHIRLAGIDAPELDQPWGQQSKWALVKLCKGQIVTARIKPEMSYDRVVAECFLPDGRDLAAELVKAGLALDWPKFSGGKYRQLEPAEARKKLWRANLRQGGVMWPADDTVPVASRNDAPSSKVLRAVPRTIAPVRAQSPSMSYRLGWLIVSGTLALLVGCNLVGGDADRNRSAAPGQQAALLASFEVAATVLNVRNEPGASAAVIGQIGQGTTVTPKRVSGSWYGIEMPDGSDGWVHSDFLSPIGE